MSLKLLKGLEVFFKKFSSKEYRGQIEGIPVALSWDN